ncbi:hypothetical protein KZP23_01645 [Echinicola marina]|uniref:hypothetical protein n=1 Tax=Echinicola marina TaxID=2859768 RepID=UPI001CF63B24|nr:hypothetical protein [Echinicola marina]UCS93767.1 hypothetical protein KZP23_01645 [Echinicola marina]
MSRTDKLVFGKTPFFSAYYLKLSTGKYQWAEWQNMGLDAVKVFGIIESLPDLLSMFGAKYSVLMSTGECKGSKVFIAQSEEIGDWYSTVQSPFLSSLGLNYSLSFRKMNKDVLELRFYQKREEAGGD